jgi:hypothetical protein
MSPMRTSPISGCKRSMGANANTTTTDHTEDTEDTTDQHGDAEARRFLQIEATEYGDQHGDTEMWRELGPGRPVR